jgi:hypothetical protein
MLGRQGRSTSYSVLLQVLVPVLFSMYYNTAKRDHNTDGGKFKKKMQRVRKQPPENSRERPQIGSEPLFFLSVQE